MDLGLAGRVALVCGSTKGLGRAVAKALAHEGARVAINGRHEDSVEHAAQQLSSESAQAVMPFVADVGDPSQAEGLEIGRASCRERVEVLEVPVAMQNIIYRVK